MAPPSDDPTVKELLDGGRVPLDPATQAELERWFGMPSAEQLTDEGKQPGPSEDGEMAAVLERRKLAVAAVDAAFVDEILLRTEDRQVPIIFKPSLALAIETTVAFFDQEMLDRVLTIGEPRDVEIPEALVDDLKECSEQALLRDLHRPEIYYDKTFEIVDAAADQRLDIVAEVKSAMSTSWRLPAFGRSALDESRTMLADLRAQRRRAWTEFLPLLQNRTVQE